MIKYLKCPFTVTVNIHPKSLLAMDVSTPESFSYGQCKALPYAAKCADLPNSYKCFLINRIKNVWRRLLRLD